MFMENNNSQKPLVAVWSLVYNHEPYLRDYFEGIIMQKTNFPFIAIVHDDCSTDGSAAIIREYAEKYPDIIKPIFETENQYSKKDGSLDRIMYEAIKASGAKYIALCEGDDYWIDPLKLQKQVDFLEAHPDYSMCVSNINILENDGSIHRSIWNTKVDQDLQIREIIINGGLYIGTASIVVRYNLYINRPDTMTKLHVGDYPLQIFMASLGKVHNLRDITCIYRFMSYGSWTQKNNTDNDSLDGLNKYIEGEQRLLDTMDQITNYKYHKLFIDRSSLFRYKCYVHRLPHIAKEIFIKNPKIIIKECSLKSIVYVCLPKSLQKFVLRIFHKS